MAVESKYFDRYNLKDVQVIQFQGGGLQIIRSVIAEEIHISTLGGAPVASASQRGLGIVSFGTTVPVFPYRLFATKDIAKPMDLKGKRIAVSNIGAGSGYIAVVHALKAMGIGEKEVTFLSLGNQPTGLVALSTGAVQAAAFQPPFTYKARE
jgi:taurine transport system substrate-binding protein